MAEAHTDIGTLELDALWDEFHRAVNMTSEELGAWLRTSSAGERSEELPENSGTERGRQVLGILKKRRTDLTDEDVRAMYAVVETVSEEREKGPTSGAVETQADESWRHRLMMLGHDPLRDW